MKIKGKTARALADASLTDSADLRRELIQYVQDHVDPDAVKVTIIMTLPDEPLDTSQLPHRAWFEVGYQ